MSPLYTPTSYPAWWSITVESAWEPRLNILLHLGKDKGRLDLKFNSVKIRSAWLAILYFRRSLKLYKKVYLNLNDRNHCEICVFSWNVFSTIIADMLSIVLFSNWGQETFPSAWYSDFSRVHERLCVFQALTIHPLVSLWSSLSPETAATMGNSSSALVRSVGTGWQAREPRMGCSDRRPILTFSSFPLLSSLSLYVLLLHAKETEEKMKDSCLLFLCFLFLLFLLPSLAKATKLKGSLPI